MLHWFHAHCICAQRPKWGSGPCQRGLCQQQSSGRQGGKIQPQELAKAMGVRREQHGLGDCDTRMKKYKDPDIRVNICWEVGDEKKCVTLPKAEAYATREWVEEQGGVVFWTQVLPD